MNRTPLSPQAQYMVELAHRLYRALLTATGDGQPPAPPVRYLDPPPVAHQDVVAGSFVSTLKYAPEDVFELAFAGSQLAFCLLSLDLHDCAVCGASGGNMGQPESHNPLCKVARMWRAVDALRVGMEVEHE